MKPLAQAVEFDDSLAKVFGLLVQHDISLIPVLRGGKAVGAIRSVEALIVLDETLDD